MLGVSFLTSTCIYMCLFVLVPGWGGGRPKDVRLCICAWVGGWGGGGCWKTKAQLCSLIFWERSGGVVDPPAPFSSAGSRRISAAASLHKATLCNLPQAHKYNCNQERRGEERRRRRDGGQWRHQEEKATDCSPLAPVLLEDDNIYPSTFKLLHIVFFLHLHMCLYANVAAYY